MNEQGLLDDIEACEGSMYMEPLPQVRKILFQWAQRSREALRRWREEGKTPDE